MAARDRKESTAYPRYIFISVVLLGVVIVVVSVVGGNLSAGQFGSASCQDVSGAPITVEGEATAIDMNIALDWAEYDCIQKVRDAQWDNAECPEICRTAP